MADKRYYMTCLDLEGRSCLVVGGGTVALEKVRGLLDCGAHVTVIAPQIAGELLALDVDVVRRGYRASDLDGRFLVVAATSTPSVNRRVFRDAEARSLLCNVVDVPELCSFILPAVMRRDPIAVAVSTGGASPALAQRIRDDVAELITPEHAELARRLRELRPWARTHLPTYDARRRDRRTVYLVGAGPGDPGLITTRGLELMRSCDALVYDRLVSPELVAEAPAGAIRIARDELAQAEIDELLIRLGRRGLEVVRLKGGDPFVFGRGGEEALALAAAGVPFEVVPGVSSLSAVPALAGIPVTHRGLSSQVTVVSGHDVEMLDLGCLARAPGTLVVFMGLGSLGALADGLVQHGKPASTPAAVVASGTTAEQRTVIAPLATIAAAAADLEAPALVVIGGVVAVAERLVAPDAVSWAAA